MPYNRYYHWFSACDPDGILTHDLQNRNLTLYTAELRSHFGVAKVTKFIRIRKASQTFLLFVVSIEMFKFVVDLI